VNIKILVGFELHRRSNGTEMKALLFLSIILPVGFLAAFRLSGVLKEPATVERITQEPVTLTLSRPSATIAMTDSTIQNGWAIEGASILAGLQIYGYRENSGDPPYNDHDGLTFRAYINVSSTHGLINGAKISFHPLDDNAVVFVSEERWTLLLENASLTAFQYFGTEDTEAYLEVDVKNSSCSLSNQLYWIFLDENTESHAAEITMEVTYAGATSILLVTVPFRLEMVQ